MQDSVRPGKHLVESRRRRRRSRRRRPTRTEQMRKTATQMWEEAVVAYERKAWAALGYGLLLIR